VEGHSGGSNYFGVLVGVYETVKRPSVGQSTPRCGGFAAVGPASRKYRSFAATASSVALLVDVGS